MPFLVTPKWLKRNVASFVANQNYLGAQVTLSEPAEGGVLGRSLVQGLKIQHAGSQNTFICVSAVKAGSNGSTLAWFEISSSAPWVEEDI